MIAVDLRGREGRARQTLLPRQGQRHKWWFASDQVHGLPEQLLAGRFHLLLDRLFENAAADPASVDAHARAVYARAYEAPEAVRAANDWYRTFRQRTSPTSRRTPRRPRRSWPWAASTAITRAS
ncbi:MULTISPECIES: hypothetical protein [unclassified Streptomyces]|uniref:hypothetical protein n=1 Tax=unclassified Streptomyces TaxID=2593676 RepID=UPI0033260EB5